jgi:hypothetical protein
MGRASSVIFTVVFLFTRLALGTNVQAPAGGAAFAVPGGKVICGNVAAPWTVEAGGTRLRPPAVATYVARSQEVPVAATALGCSTSKETMTLVVTGPLPAVDRRSVELWVDEGRLSVRGSDLEGTRVHWQAKDRTGSDTCVSAEQPTPQPSCSFAVARTLPADSTQVTFWLLPAGGRLGTDTYDAAGRLVGLESLRLAPARIVISSLLPAERVLDVSAGGARLAVAHPEAVAAVDCAPARCEFAHNEIRVRGLAAGARSLVVRVHLVPHVVLREGELLASTASMRVDLAYCPLTVASGPPLREVDDVRVVVRLDARCGAAANSFHWTANANPATVLAVESQGDGVFVLLGAGRFASDRVTLTAVRPDIEASVVALGTTPTRAPPRLRTSVELPGYGDVNFIPTNREAVLGFTAPGHQGTLVPLALEGAYSIRQRGRQTLIRGVPGSGGYVALRFGLRNAALPGKLAEVDLAQLVDTVQRPLEAANVPAPISASIGGLRPVVVLVCADRAGRPVTVEPGKTLHVPFPRRDSCRLIIHRERIPSEDGEQRLDLDIEIASAGGTTRSDGRLSQRLVMRHGAEERVFWIHGVQAQFDRINVRVTHVLDETQYLRARSERLEVPAAQWTVVVEDADLRFYATAAIPVSLFRFSNNRGGVGNGSLTLNVGMLSRLTWLTRDGTEGLLGLEAGVMGMGLASDNERQLNIVSGIGLSVPLGNVRQPSQAALNIHAWAAYRLGRKSAILSSPTGQVLDTIQLNPWSFVFGPSVTIGNIGLDL